MNAQWSSKYECTMNVEYFLLWPMKRSVVLSIASCRHFFLVPYLLSSSPVVPGFSLLWWRRITGPNFHVHILLLFLSDFSFQHLLQPKRLISKQDGDSTAQVVCFSITDKLISNFLNYSGHLIETIQRKPWSQIDLGLNSSQSFWLTCSGFPRF